MILTPESDEYSQNVVGSAHEPQGKYVFHVRLGSGLVDDALGTQLTTRLDCHVKSSFTAEDLQNRTGSGKKKNSYLNNVSDQSINRETQKFLDLVPW
jgi:hypothetical protein